MSLDPQVTALLERAASSDAPALGEGTPQQGRENFAAMTELLGVPAPAVRAIDEIRIPGPGGEIRTLVITPQHSGGGPLPVLIYYHGGGWVIGSPETHRREACYYADAAQCVVVVPDYRLAPEHRFPAAPEDCYAVLQWVAAEAESINGDATRIAVAGDSAGGNLAAVVTQMAKSHGGPRLALQLLIYPATRMGQSTESYRLFNDGYFLTGKAMNWFFDHYLATAGDRDNPLASPLLAQDLRGLAPAFIMTAGFDPLRDEGAAYADRLKAAGVAVDYVCYDQQIHGFVSMAGAIDQGRQFLDQAAGALRRAFAS